MPVKGHFEVAVPTSAPASGPIRTPSDPTTWVSWGFIIIAISEEQLGQA